MIKFKNIFAVCGAVAISSISSFSAFADEQLTKEEALDLVFKYRIEDNITDKESLNFWGITDNEQGVANSPLAALNYYRIGEFLNSYDLSSKTKDDIYKIYDDLVEWYTWDSDTGLTFDIDENGQIYGRYDNDNGFEYYYFKPTKDGWDLIDTEHNKIYGSYKRLTQYAGVFDFSEYLEDNSDEDDNNFSEENNIQAEKESSDNQTTVKATDSLATSVDSNSNMISSQIDSGSSGAAQPSVNISSITDSSPKAVVAVGDDNQTVATPKSKSSTSSTTLNVTTVTPTTEKKSNVGIIVGTISILAIAGIGGFFAYKKSKK